MAHKLYTSLDYSSRIRGIGISSDVIFTIIKQDLEVAKKAIEDDKFDFLSFSGNRIMVDLLVDDNVKLMLLGYMIKELDGELRNLSQNRYDVYESIKPELISYLNDLQGYVDGKNIDAKVYWRKFSSIEERLRRDLLDDIDALSYDEQGEFAKQFGVKFIDIVYSKKQEDIQIITNQISRATFELSRNFNQHGGREALVVYFVFKVLDNYCNYLVGEMKQDSDKILAKENNLSEYIDKIYRLKPLTANLDKLCEESNMIIDEVGRSAIMLSFSREVALPKEKELTLPADVQRKITDIIKKSAQRDKKISKKAGGRR